ncbi:MAG: O-antigen ligase family protein [Proteobacteria bacterium]|nr:O-antigen ligase family protein [Pseudomonadota bacterium]
MTAALVPWEGLYALAVGCLALGFASVSSVLSRREQDRSGLVIFGIAVSISVFALVHALTDQTAVLGFIEMREPQLPFFAPFGNPNHLASFWLLTAPVSVFWTHKLWKRRSAGAVLALAGLSVMVVGWLLVHNPGANLAALGVLAFALSRRLWWPLRLASMAAFAGVGLAVVNLGYRLYPHWAESSPERRLDQWADLPAMFLAQPLTGWGVGSFQWAYAPFRTFPGFRSYRTAHSDLLQWVVDTGLVGSVVLGVVVWWLWRHWPKSSGSGWALDLGLLGVGLHALGDFPLHVPLVLVSVAAVGGLRLGLVRVDLPGRVKTHNRVVVAVTLGSVVASGLLLGHAAAVDRAVAVVWEQKTGEQAQAAAAQVRWLAPWRPEPGFARAWRALEDGNHELATRAALRLRARHPESGATLLNAAGVLMRAGSVAEAEKTALLALEREPYEYRAHVLIARARQRSGRREESLESYRVALSHWPAETAGGAWVFGEVERLRPDEAWWEDSLEGASPYWSLYRGDHLMRTGQIGRAGELYERAADREPRYAVWGGRIRWLLAVGRLDEAERAALDRLEERPDDLGVRLTLGRLYSQREQHDRAVALYQEGSRFGHDLTGPLLLVVAAAEGPEEALVQAQTFASAGRLSPAGLLVVAELRLKAGDPAGCVHDLDETLWDKALADRVADLRRRCLAECVSCSASKP